MLMDVNCMLFCITCGSASAGWNQSKVLIPAQRAMNSDVPTSSWLQFSVLVAGTEKPAARGADRVNGQRAGDILRENRAL
jgi:hypothetical protein